MTRTYHAADFSMTLHELACPDFPWGGEWRVQPGWSPQIMMTADQLAEFMALYPH